MAWNCINVGIADQEQVLALAANLYTGTMRERKALELELLSLDPRAWEQVQKVMDCSYRWRCNSPFCYHCSVAANSKHLRRVKPGTVLDTSVVNYVGPAYGQPLSRNYRVRAGQAQAKCFDGLPRNEVGASTVMLGVMRGGDPYRELHSRFRTYLRAGLTSLGSDTVAYLRLEHVMKRVGDIRQSFDQIMPGGHDLIDIPDDEIVALVHGHGLIHVPGVTPSQVAELLRKTFPGKNRVHSQPVKPEKIAACGIVTGGAQGYAEYSGKKKTPRLDKAERNSSDRRTGQQVDLEDHEDDEPWNDDGNELESQDLADKCEGLDSIHHPAAFGSTDHRDAAIALFADAEIHRALHGFNMTVRIGANNRSGEGDEVSRAEPVTAEGKDSSRVSSAVPKDVVGTHLAKVRSPASPVSPLPQIDQNEPQADSLAPQTWTKIAGYHISPWFACGATRYNSSPISLSYCPDFIEPKWVRFQNRVSFGLDLRPPVQHHRAGRC